MDSYNAPGTGKTPRKRKRQVPAIFTFRMDPELKNLLGDEADKVGLPMNEYLARILAEHINRPDLARIPRKSMGRPRVRCVQDNDVDAAPEEDPEPVPA